MIKYVGAVVRKLSQLVIVADIDLLGNIKYLSKYVQEIYGSLKNKTICSKNKRPIYHNPQILQHTAKAIQ